MKLINTVFALLFATTTTFAQTSYPPPSTTPTNNPTSLGLGSYLTTWDSRADAAIPDNRDTQLTQYITSNLANQPIPTNSWWSSIVWAGVNQPWQDWGNRGSHNVSYAHPFALKPEINGMRLYAPRQQDFWSASYAFVGTMPAPVTEWINGVETPLYNTVYFKDLDVVLGNTAASGNYSVNVHNYSDWFVTARMQAGPASMDLTFGHGSPYVFAVYNNGNPTLNFSTDGTAPVAAKTPEIWSGTNSSRVIGFSVEGRDYAAFAPQGTTWSGLGTAKITAQLPTDKKYFTVAALPSRSALGLIEKYAYNHVIDSQVSWVYRGSDSKLLSTYKVTTQNYAESTSSGTLMGLYPHQWRKLSSGATLTTNSYFTPRGLMKLAEGTSFTTAVTFHGVVPSLPPLTNASDKTRMSAWIDDIKTTHGFNKLDTYYTGKRLGKIASLVPLAQQVGNTSASQQFLGELKWRLEGWLKADVIDNLEPSPYLRNAFYYNSHWGTLLGIDGSFGSLKELNDHHFHYGYYVRAAAEVARNDKNWSQPQAFGGMVEMLIRDYGNWERPRNTATSARGKMFPFLRNFDIYAGHSWASGHARFGAGNNNESSSEAMNAWTGMILWGEETGNTAMRDAGIFLYSTEMTAIQEYWNNVYEDNYHPNYNKPMASLIWGGKTDYATWFSAAPEAMHGIILLPIQSGSLYLSHFPENVKKNFEFMANGRTQFAMWDAIFYAYQAIYDPAAALNNFNNNEGRLRSSWDGPASFTEEGNSLPNTFNWIKTFQQYGKVDKNVVALNHAAYAVFSNGTMRTYVVYNASALNAKTVNFSDGVGVTANPGEVKVYTGFIQDPLTPPDAPVLGSAQAQSGAVNLSWQSVNRSTGYRVTYGLVGGAQLGVVDVGAVNQKLVTGLTNGISYYFSVQAYNSYGTSIQSNTLNATPMGVNASSSLSTLSSAMSSSSSQPSQVSSSSLSSTVSSVSSQSSVSSATGLGVVQMTQQTGGGMRFSIRLGERKNQVHLFARRNGQQDYVVIDVQTQPGGETNNGDGTYTYQVIRSGAYTAGNLVEARFYTYTPASGQVYYPGPIDSYWTSATYGAVSSASSSISSSASSAISSSVINRSSSSSSVASSVASAGYYQSTTLPNGAPVAYTTSATYAQGSVKITFTTSENINWAWCFTPGWNEMRRVSGNSFEVIIPNQIPGATLSYYFTVSTASRGEANNNNAQHRWVIQ